MTKNKGKSKNKSKSNREPKVDQKPTERKNNDEIKEKKETNSSPENAKMQMADTDDHTEVEEEEMKDIEDRVSTNNDDGAESDRSNKNRDEKQSPKRLNRDSRQFKGKHDSFSKNTERREPYPLKTRRSEPVKISSQHNRENNNWKNKQRHSSYNENATRLGKRNTRWDNPDPDPVRRASRNFEYRQYEEEYRKTEGVIDYIKTNEIDQDLFLMPKEYSLAHCVAEDMNMGSGIAVQFRREFKKVDELLNQRQQSGGLAVLKDNDRFIYYLVTKRHSSGKPTYATLFSSLLALANHVVENDVKKLAMPRIGCGLDRLDWDRVRHMIEYVFRKFDVDVEIVICNFLQTEDSPRTRHKNCPLVNVIYPINTIEENTIIVYLSSEDEYVSKEMEELDEKFHFLADFRAARKRLGDVVIFDKNQSYVLAGCIVKKSNTDQIDFVSFQKCIWEIRKLNDKKYQFEYVGFQAIKDKDNCVNYKITNILRNTFQNVDVYVCWVGEVQQEMSVRDRFSDSFTTKKADSGDKHGERDPSPQKLYRQNSFTWKDKYATEQLYYGREDYGKTSSASQFGSNKQNNESDTNEEASTSQMRENSESDEKTSTDWWGEDNVKTSRRSLFEPNEQSEQSNEYSKTSVHEISRTSEMSEDWDRDEKKESSTQKSYQPRIFSRSNNKKSSKGFCEADNFKTSRETQFEADQNKVNETNWSSENLKPSTSQKSKDWQEDSIMHISKKYKKSEYVSDLVKAKISTSSGLVSQLYNEMDSESSSDWNQEYEERSAMNSEYQKYQSDYKSQKIYLKKLKERHWSNLPNKCAEVCYVSEDFYVQSPMTPKFDISYRIGKLLNCLKKEGSCEVLKGVPNHIFCLIVKKLPTSKCRHDVVFRSLQLLRQQALFLQTKTLMFPKMENTKGDSFNWSEVPYMIEFLFEKVPSEIFSVSYDNKEKYIEYIKKTNEVNLNHVKHPLFQMKIKSVIFYWTSEDGYITQEMRALDRKFKFLIHFQKSVKRLGEIIRYKPNEDFVLYGCVIRKTLEYAIDFDALQKCVVSVNDRNKEESFSFAAAPAVEDGDEATNYKIINILMNCLKHVTIDFCWTGNLKEKMPLNRN